MGNSRHASGRAVTRQLCDPAESLDNDRDAVHAREEGEAQEATGSEAEEAVKVRTTSTGSEKTRAASRRRYPLPNSSHHFSTTTHLFSASFFKTFHPPPAVALEVAQISKSSSSSSSPVTALPRRGEEQDAEPKRPLRGLCEDREFDAGPASGHTEVAV